MSVEAAFLAKGEQSPHPLWCLPAEEQINYHHATHTRGSCLNHAACRHLRLAYCSGIVYSLLVYDVYLVCTHSMQRYPESRYNSHEMCLTGTFVALFILWKCHMDNVTVWFKTLQKISIHCISIPSDQYTALTLLLLPNQHFLMITFNHGSVPIQHFQR